MGTFPGSSPSAFEAPRTLRLSVFSTMNESVGGDGPVHVPVLAEEILRLLGGGRGASSPQGLVVDATLGAGGHSALLLERFPRLRLLGVDQDPEILTIARERLEPFTDRARIEHARMSELDGILGTLDEAPVAMLMDLGASSLQLDRPERGFSFSWDGPLDMRMDPRRQRTAADIVNRWDEGDLADLFYHEGGERGARRVARAIVDSRRRAPFRRTRALSEIVALSLGRPIRSRSGEGTRRGAIHPATRVFQALRRAVNEEAEELDAGLAAARRHLAPDGLLLAVSFHSGEDGVVKRFLAEGARTGEWDLLTRRPVEASAEEVRSNPRARSAKLRSARRRLAQGGEA
ncbi:MAG: 16S rRNA (cytosine(1402)-N(4))-methyltransferase RsmH [Planctomycetota bacterium]